MKQLAIVSATLLLAVSGAGGAGAQTPKRGGTVLMPGGPEPACITPYIEACAGGSLVTFADFLPRATLPGAFEVRPDLTWKAQLVSRVEASTKPPLRLVFHVRPEARWSDGIPVTAADFVFTYRTLRKYRTQLDDVDRTTVDLIRSARALDRKTVEVVLPWSATSWRGNLFRVVLPQHVLAGQDYPSVWKERIENPRTGRPIGGGPFLVAGWERGKQLTLVRNRHYWGSHTAHLDGIVLRFDLANPAASLAGGAIDVVWGLGPEAVAPLRSLSGIRVASSLWPAMDQISINVAAGGNALLRKRLVRQALAYGIDRPAIVRQLFGETLPKQRAAQNGFYLNSSPYYRSNWGRYRYRPAESKRLLVQAGCQLGTDGIYVCGGERLSLRFVTRGDVARRVASLELIRDQLKRAGIEVVPQFGSGNVIIEQALANGMYDLLEYTSVYPDPPDEYALTPLMCKDPFGFPWTRYCRNVDPAELSRASHTLEGRERAQAVNQVDAALAEEVPLLLLYWTPGIAAVGANVRGYVHHSLDPFWRAEEWWLDRGAARSSGSATGM